MAASAGSPTALVNGAGIGVFTPFLEITEDQWDNTFAVNTKGSFLMCREFVSRTEGPAAIVNIASIGARLGGDMLAHYGPSKAAVIEMSHSVARIGATRGLRSNTVMPGLILTDMWLRTIKELRRRDPSLTDVSDADVFDSFVAQMVPMGRAQTPGDIAEMVAFFAQRQGSQRHRADDCRRRRRRDDLIGSMAVSPSATGRRRAGSWHP